MLKTIIGTGEKPGWGSGRLYFRKELAELYEAKGADAPTAKAANLEWALAVREWSTLFSMHRNRIAKPPTGPNAPTLAQLRNDYADAFFDVNRATVAANQQVLKGTPTEKEKLQKLYDDVGRKFADIEKEMLKPPATEWEPEVQNRYADLLKANPPILASYKAAGGKAFLEKLPPKPAP